MKSYQLTLYLRFFFKKIDMTMRSFALLDRILSKVRFILVLIFLLHFQGSLKIEFAILKHPFLISVQTTV